MRSNKERLLRISVAGQVSTATFGHIPDLYFGQPYIVSAEGVPAMVPLSGGIVYNVRVGDQASGWVADHLEPGVTIKNPDDAANGALQVYSCLGNEAVVMTGDARGAIGTVIGKHGHLGHIMVDFVPEVLSQLAIDDKVLVRAEGTGLVLEDYPDVHVQSLAPQVLDALELSEGQGGKLRVPVATVVPRDLVGAGSGSASNRSDLDIMTQDRTAVAEFGLGDLRFGDFVAITDYGSSYGMGYLTGSMTIGVVTHGDSRIAGHGIGITPVMSSEHGLIQPVVDQNANLATLLGINS